MNRTEQYIITMAIAILNEQDTVTTLEVKNELRRLFPNMKWFQSDVSDVMDNLQQAGHLAFTDNGTHRIYTLPKKSHTQKAPSPAGKISKIKAVELIENSNGRPFTVTFVKKDNTDRVMQCTYSPQRPNASSKLGYLTVLDTEVNELRSVNAQTIKELIINGSKYPVK